MVPNERHLLMTFKIKLSNFAKLGTDTLFYFGRM